MLFKCFIGDRGIDAMQNLDVDERIGGKLFSWKKHLWEPASTVKPLAIPLLKDPFYLLIHRLKFQRLLPVLFSVLWRNHVVFLKSLSLLSRVLVPSLMPTMAWTPPFTLSTQALPIDNADFLASGRLCHDSHVCVKCSVTLFLSWVMELLHNMYPPWGLFSPTSRNTMG